MQRRFDLGWLLMIALGIFAALPLIVQAGLPNSHDYLYHVYRVAEMGRSWENGVYFPRWAEGAYFGYGSPLWHFYASLTYYLTAVPTRFFGVSATDALRLIIVLSFVLMAVGMYGFMREQMSRKGAVLGAVAFVFSPYLLFTAPYVRGAYPELLGIGIFAIAMWRFGAVLKRPSGMNIAGSTVSVYLLVIAHNLLGALMSAVIAGWILWHMLATILTRRGEWRLLRPHILAFISLGLGAGLGAYFWLPVLLETNTVFIQNLTSVALLDYHNFFVPFGTLLAPMPVADTNAINGLQLSYSIGLPQWLGAISGFIAVGYGIVTAVMIRHRDDRILRQGVYFGLLGAFSLFLVTPTSQFIWDSIHALKFVQFPFRFLGVVAFSLAFVVGLNALWLEKLPKRVSDAMFALGIVLIMGFAAPAFRVPEWTNLDTDTSLSAYHASEEAGIQLGMTFTDEYRPRSVNTLPTSTKRLLDDYADGYPINKANVPEGVTADVRFNTPIWLEWDVTTPTDFTMEVLTFYWEGWTVYVDGVQAPITPSPNHGFITFPVSAGEHNVRLYLGTTPPRLLGGMISGLSLIALLAIVSLRLGKALANRGIFVAPPPREQLGWIVPVGVGIGAVVMVVLSYGNVLAHPAPQFSTDYRFDETVQVIGYDLNGTTFNTGDTVELTVYWEATAPQPINYSSFVHIGAVDAPPIAQSDKLHPADRDMKTRWRVGGYLSDTYRITLPANASGDWTIFVGLYTCEGVEGDCGNGLRPTVTDASGQVLGDKLALTSITVR